MEQAEVAATGHTLAVSPLQAVFTSPDDFTVVAGVSSLTVTYLRDTTIPVYSRVLLEIALAEEEQVFAATGATHERTLADRFATRYEPEDFGAVGDGVTDDYTALAAALVAHSARQVPLYIPEGKSYFTGTALASNEDFIHIEGGGRIVTDITSGNLLLIGSGRTLIDTLTVAGNITIGAKTVTVDSTAELQEDDVIRFVSTKAWYNDPRGASGFSDANATGFAQSGGAATITLEAGNTLTALLVEGQWLTITAGTGIGQARLVTDFDVGTEIATVSEDWETIPDTTSVYVFPQATKGETHVVARVIDATTFEVKGVIADGYHVVDTVTEGKAKEAVSIEVHRSYKPIIKGITLEGPTTGEAELALLQLTYALNGEIDIATKGSRSAGMRMTTCYGCKVKLRAETSIDTETGYGIQISHCSKTDVDASGWNCRRVVDVSGTTPCDLTRIHSFYVSGGGLQEDGSEYFPLGAVNNNGLGSHGPGRSTTYENGYIDGVESGIYERGRGSVIRNVRFGPYVTYPVQYLFGGTHEFYGNVIDAGVFEDVGAVNTYQESDDFDGTARDACAKCIAVIGANLLVRDADCQINIHHNTAKVQQHLVEVQTSGGSSVTLTHLKVYDNDVEFFPLTASDELAMFGKYTGSSAATVVLKGEKLGPNRLRTAAANLGPVLYGAEFSLSSTVGVKFEIGNGYHTIRLADDTVGTLLCPLLGRDHIRLSVILNDDSATFFDGWLKRNSATLVGTIVGNVEALATAPTDGTSDGTDTFLGFHFDGGKVTVKNRRGATRSADILFHGFH